MEFHEHLAKYLGDMGVEQVTTKLDGSGVQVKDLAGEQSSVYLFTLDAKNVPDAVEEVFHVIKKVEARLGERDYEWDVRARVIDKGEFFAQVVITARCDLGTVFVHGVRGDFGLMHKPGKDSVFDQPHQRDLCAIHAEPHTRRYLKLLCRQIPGLEIEQLNPAKAPVIVHYVDDEPAPIYEYPPIHAVIAATADGLVSATVKIMAQQFDKLTDEQKKVARYCVQYGVVSEVEREGEPVLELLVVAEVTVPGGKRKDAQIDTPLNIDAAIEHQYAQNHSLNRIRVEVGNNEWTPSEEDVQYIRAALSTAIIERSEGQQVAAIESRWVHVSDDSLYDACHAGGPVFEDDGNTVTVSTNAPKRTIIHLTVGGVDYHPTAEELGEICRVFETAKLDPLGAVIVTREGVKMEGAINASFRIFEPDEQLDFVVDGTRK